MQQKHISGTTWKNFHLKEIKLIPSVDNDMSTLPFEGLLICTASLNSQKHNMLGPLNWEEYVRKEGVRFQLAGLLSVVVNTPAGARMVKVTGPACLLLALLSLFTLIHPGRVYYQEVNPCRSQDGEGDRTSLSAPHTPVPVHPASPR